MNNKNIKKKSKWKPFDLFEKNIPAGNREKETNRHKKKKPDTRDDLKVGDHFPNANIGWLFYKDYYQGIDFSLNKDDKELTTRFEEKNQNITGKKLSQYSHETGLLKLDFQSLQSFELTTVYPGLATGLGSPHETQRQGEYKLGFHFDHTTGLPVIPGSSVKGVLRSAFKHPSYIREILRQIDKSIDLENTGDDKIESLEKEIFEGAGKGEKDIFHDAMIVSTGNRDRLFLADDFITPHRYEFKDPVPLQFLKVLPQVTFRFHFRLSNGKVVPVSAGSKLKLFKHILLDLGIGAKTNVGYGKFTG
jgi:CRISPR-associated protein Cmr6